MLDLHDPRPAISPERWAVIDAWFDGVMKSQADLAQEMAGWIPPDDAVQAVLIDRSSHVAVYVRQDGSRSVKSIPEFNDDQSAPPLQPRDQVADAIRIQLEAIIGALRAKLEGRSGIEDIWLAPEMSGVVFDFVDGTTDLVPLPRFLAFCRKHMI